ncbi:MAG TPA: methyltransferase domain-containing protein [Mycobacterium sp.]|nr:methyltransferase domain-containing protein [Mycobacterium sp.]
MELDVRQHHRAWAIAAVGAVLASLMLLHAASRQRWYRVVYRLAYRLGLTVWQRPAPPADLVTLVEGPSALPPGRALDLGCGTGTDTIYLATHGWEVTAVDMVPQALSTARRNATAAGVSPRFLQGDVTRLRDLGVGDGYTLVLDFGCLHTLPEDLRSAYVAGVSSVAASGATFLLYGFRRPPKAAPMHAGLTVDEVRHRFGPAGWQLVRADRTSADTSGIRVRRADDLFELWRYQLHRSST